MVGTGLNAECCFGPPEDGLRLAMGSRAGDDTSEAVMGRSVYLGT